MKDHQAKYLPCKMSHPSDPPLIPTNQVLPIISLLVSRICTIKEANKNPSQIHLNKRHHMF
jgi:hypothetical protein